MSNNIDFYTNMRTKYIVITKKIGHVMDDYFGADDYSVAKNAYELAKTNERYEWIALIVRNRQPNTPNVSLHLRLFCDRRDKQDWRITGLEGLINSLPSTYL